MPLESERAAVCDDGTGKWEVKIQTESTESCEISNEEGDSCLIYVCPVSFVGNTVPSFITDIRYLHLSEIPHEAPKPAWSRF